MRMLIICRFGHLRGKRRTIKGYPMFQLKRSVLPITLGLLAAMPALAQQDDPAESANNDQMEEVLVFGRMSRYSALKSDIPILETARSVSLPCGLKSSSIINRRSSVRIIDFNVSMTSANRGV